MPERHWWAVLLLASAVVLWINPVGFIGGGMDDWQYINAARCWRNHGPCLPHDHWQARWLLIGPLAAVTTLFGESRFTVGIVPLCASAASLLLLAEVGNRLLGKPVGFIASLLMLAVPAFSMQFLEPTVDSIELALVLGGFLASLTYKEHRSLSAAFASGLSFSLAMQVRETAFPAVLFTLIFMVIGKERPSIAAAAAALMGFFLPIAAELIIFWRSTGDPFWRFRLDLAHGNIPSSELNVRVDPKRGPLFNKDYIANWRRVPGIHIHWAVDGLVNLFANALAGMSLGLTALILLVSRSLGSVRRLEAFCLWLIGILYASVLIYVFAIDPKARMMYVPLSLTNLALALLLWDLRSRIALVVSVAAACAGVGGIELYVMPNIHRAEVAAERWIPEHPGEIELDENTRRHLALLPAAEALPNVGSERSYLLYSSAVPCARWIRINGLKRGALRLVSEQPVTRLQWLMPSLGTPLCLFRYNEQLTNKEIQTAIDRTQPQFIGSLQHQVGLPRSR